MIIRNSDLCNSGQINYTDWLIATSNSKEVFNDENLKFAFEFLDPLGKGQIGYY